MAVSADLRVKEILAQGQIHRYGRCHHTGVCLCVSRDQKLGRAWLVVSRALRWVEWGGTQELRNEEVSPSEFVQPLMSSSPRGGNPIPSGWDLVLWADNLLYTWDSRNLSVRDIMGLQMAKKKHPRLWAGPISAELRSVGRGPHCLYSTVLFCSLPPADLHDGYHI